MTQARDTRSLLLKAARVVLVFALVFYTSLRVEILVAYGEGSSPGPVVADDPTTHEEGSTLDGLMIFEWVPAEKPADEGLWKPVQNADSFAAEGKKAVIKLAADDADTHYFAIVPVWSDKDKPDDAGVKEATIANADLAKWAASEPDAPEGTYVSQKVLESNVLAVQPIKVGTESVSCKVVKSETRPETWEASFDIEVEPAAVEPTISIQDVDVNILDNKSEEVSSDLVLAADQVGKTYQLNARVDFPDLSSETGEKITYVTTSDKSLAELSDNKLSNPAWSLMSENAPATVDEKGLLTITGEGEFQISCTVSLQDAEEGESSTSDSITVKVGTAQKPDDPQGDNKPESTLTIVADASAFVTDAGSGSGDAGSGDAGSGSGSSASTDPSAGSGSSASTDPASGGSEDPSSGQGSGVVAQEASEPGVIERTYDAAAIEALATGEPRLFNVLIGGQPTAITGKGASLVDLLRSTFKESNMDLDSLPVQSITFETRTVKQTIPWDYLKNSKTNPILATKSYVHGKDDPADQAVDTSKLVENTRFRLLFSDFSALPEDATSKDADDYRWVNKVVVNFAKSDSDRLAVDISYRPVPKGEDATLVAVPNHNVTGSWNCYWEVSDDGKTGWSPVGDDGQTLTVPTSNETIGKWYRVTVKNDTGSTDDPNGLLAISQPEQLREGKGVVLKYNPPQAGQMAVFRTYLIGVDASMVQEYIWEASIDGGATWTYAEDYLKKQKNSTLKLQTNAVDNSGGSSGGGGGSTPPLIYFKVTVVLKENVPDFNRESNVQPFTVHVGDADTDKGGGGDNGEPHDGDNPSGGAGGQPSSGPTSGGTTPSVPRPTVTEIQNITVEDSPAPSQALDAEGSPTPSAPQTEGNPTQLYINDNVTEVINEQQQEIQEQVESKVPGARWTALNTLNPTGDDVRRVLENNPIAPLVLPTGLGILVAGGLEKFLFFRRQL